MKKQEIIFTLPTPCCDGYCLENHSIQVTIHVEEEKILIRGWDYWRGEAVEFEKDWNTESGEKGKLLIIKLE